HRHPGARVAQSARHPERGCGRLPGALCDRQLHRAQRFPEPQEFAKQGLQVAAGMPLASDEGPDFKTFRLGLLGPDKLQHPDRTVATFDRALDAALA
ncbi:MAG: hypothetical protein ACRC2B_01910, partial [Rubrivivax sp.]